MDRRQILDALVALTPPQLDEVVAKAPVHPRYITTGGSQVTRATELITLAGQQADGLVVIEGLVRAVTGAAGADPVRAWVDAGFRAHRVIRVIGFEDRLKIRLPPVVS